MRSHHHRCTAGLNTAVVQVYSQCKLTGPNIGEVIGVDQLGAWQICTSPQVQPSSDDITGSMVT